MHSKKTNVNAIIGFGLSLASFIVNNVYGLFAIAGLILSIIGLSQINERGEKGKAFAIIGIIASSFVFITIFLGTILEYLGY